MHSQNLWYFHVEKSSLPNYNVNNLLSRILRQQINNIYFKACEMKCIYCI